MEKFDVIVIGTGSGSSVAQRCATAGKKTAIIDSHPYGGTCELRGCDPKKELVGIADVISLNTRLQGKGIATSARPSWKDYSSALCSEPVEGMAVVKFFAII